MRRLVIFFAVWSAVSFASAFAQGPPVGGPGAGSSTLITKAMPDFTPSPPTLTINGVGFGSNPQVSIGAALGILMDLTDSITFSDDNVITVNLPMNIQPGSYILVVEAGTGPTLTGILDVTIGAVGPEGPQGEQGEQGEQGNDGQDAVWGVNGNDAFYTAGFVGIGRTDPMSLLDVAVNGHFSTGLSVGNAGNPPNFLFDVGGSGTVAVFSNQVDADLQI